MRVLLLEDSPTQGEFVVDMLRDRGFDPVWCDTYDGAVQAASHVEASVCVADFDLHDRHGRTGLDFLSTFDGRRILFSGVRRDVPDGVELVTKDRPLALLDLLAEDAHN